MKKIILSISVLSSSLISINSFASNSKTENNLSKYLENNDKYIKLNQNQTENLIRNFPLDIESDKNYYLNCNTDGCIAVAYNEQNIPIETVYYSALSEKNTNKIHVIVQKYSYESSIGEEFYFQLENNRHKKRSNDNNDRWSTKNLGKSSVNGVAIGLVSDYVMSRIDHYANMASRGMRQFGREAGYAYDQHKVNSLANGGHITDRSPNKGMGGRQYAR